MSADNCWCGRIRIGNCVRCSAPLCEQHSKAKTVLGYTPRKLKMTLAETAYQRGLYIKPGGDDVVLCTDCCRQECEQEVQTALVASQQWPKDPFWRAVTGLEGGYFYEQLFDGITQQLAISSWMAAARSLGIKPERIVTGQKIIRDSRPAGFFREAQSEVTEDIVAEAWSFPDVKLGVVETYNRGDGLRSYSDDPSYDYLPVWLTVDGHLMWRDSSTSLSPVDELSPHEVMRLTLGMARRIGAGRGHWEEPGRWC